MTAALALLGALAPRAAALDVHVHVGLDGLLVDGAWTPVTVRCTLAAGEPPFEGRVVLARPRETVGRVEAPLRVEPGSSVTARLSVPAAAGMTYAVRVLDGAGRLVAEGQPADPLTVLLPEERLVVVCGPLGAGALGSAPAADRPRVACLRPEHLPRDAHVLAAAAAVVLAPNDLGGHVELARDPALVGALERYVRGGGTLALLPGGAGAWWTDAPLDALAPAHAQGRGAEPAGALEPLLGPGAPGDAARSVPVLALAPRPGARVLAAGERHALVVERRLGRGRVVLLAFDPDGEGLRGAPRAPAFLLDQLGAEAPPASPLRAADADALLAEVLQATPTLGTGWFYLLAAAAAAHVLGVSLVTSLVARRRGPWAGLALPPLISVGVAALLLAAGALGRGRPQVTTLAIAVHDDPSGEVARVHGAVGVVAGGPTRVWVELPPALRPEAQPLAGIDLLRPRGRAVALRDRPGRPALVGPLEVAAHGRATLLLGGQAAPAAAAEDAALATGPRLRVQVVPSVIDVVGGAPTPELWPRVRVQNAGDAPVDGLQLLALGPSTARLIALPPLGPGEATTIVTAPEHTLQAPADAPALPARLVEAVARRIEAAWVRAAAGGPAGVQPLAPAWVLHATVEEGSPVPVLAGEEGPALPARTLRVTCVPAVEP